MKRIVWVFFLTLLLALGSVGPAAAITNGHLDGNRHPAVGSLGIDFPEGRGIFCSGALIAPHVFLTAAHCVLWLMPMDVSRVFVSFDAHFDPSTSPVHYGTYVIAPNAWHDFARANDLALVLLDEPVTEIQPVALPDENLFDELGPRGLRNEKFTAVGYGSTGRMIGGGKPAFQYDDTRRYSVSSFDALNNNWLHLSMNAALGDGGTCYGDSGGPNFLGAGESETNIIAGITVTGDVPCMATNVIYRVDTPSAREFLGRFVNLP
jgi:secreted trypsin-like serine protease